MYRQTRIALIATSAIATALLLSAPAWAQRGHGGGNGKAPEPQRSEQRGGGQDRRDDDRRAGSVPAPVRQDAQRPQALAQRPPDQRQQVPAPVQRGQQVRPDQRGQQTQRPQVQAPVPARPGNYGRGAQQQPYYGPPYNNGNGRGYGWGRAGYGPSYVARRPVFVQPYYYFRPRTTLSFGFHVGFGVAYPWNYWDPYGFYNYGIAVRPGYNVRNYYTHVGGVSFDVQPWGASVYVDGRYVGVAADFGPNQMPLTLPAGKHKVEFRCEGFRTAKFDIHVYAGQVIPYQGYLEYR